MSTLRKWKLAQGRKRMRPNNHDNPPYNNGAPPPTPAQSSPNRINYYGTNPVAEEHILPPHLVPQATYPHHFEWTGRNVTELSFNYSLVFQDSAIGNKNL